jgi:hypothetical protein
LNGAKDMGEDKIGSAEFLLKEYEESYNHMRHYDNSLITLIKFVFSFNLGLLSACLAIYNYFSDQKLMVIKPLGYILVMGFAIGIIFLCLCTRNRMYFVIVARHLNNLRKYFSGKIGDEFSFEEMYTNPKYPKYFNSFSTYSITIYLISIFNAVLMSVGVSLIIQIFFVIFYLKRKEGKKADEAVHRHKS